MFREAPRRSSCIFGLSLVRRMDGKGRGDGSWWKKEVKAGLVSWKKRRVGQWVVPVVGWSREPCGVELELPEGRTARRSERRLS